MRKKYLSALLFGALLFASAGSFQSCKDYDDDIDNLKEQLDQKASLEDLNAKVEQLNTAVSEAKTTAQEALDKAQEALDKANQGGTEGVSEDEMNAAIEAAKAEIEKEMEKLAKLEDVEAKIKAMQETLDAAVGATEEQLQNLQTQVEALTVQVMNVIGSRLTSVTLIPEMHINGIPAITFTTLQYTPQTYKVNTHDGVVEGDHSKNPWLDHEAAGKPLYISTEKNEVNYQLNPNIGITNEDVNTPSFDCITSTNITRAAEILNNKPIEVTGYDVKDGVMTVTFKKNSEYLGETLGTTGEAHGTDKKESFYMASLKTPIAEKNLTDAEKEAGEDVYVNSEYSRIEEIVAEPYLANSRTDFEKAKNNAFANETQTDAQGEFYIHYHDSICLYNSGNNEMVDVLAPYDEPLDLSKLVTVCATDVDDHKTHYELDNYADYGLEFRFALAEGKYLQGDLETNEQEFGKILNGHFLKSEVYDVELGNNEYSKTSIGREPIVRVSLVDAKNNNNLVAQRYIKVRWSGEKSQTIPAVDLGTNDVTCHDMWKQLFSQDMNEKIYHQVKFDGDQSISKTQFHTIYTDMKITGLRKDGQNIDLSTLNYTTDANDWNEGTDRVEVDGGEAIKNDKDLVFAMLPDAKDNTSYNLVWAMNPETVGKLAGSNGKYASTYEIDVEYIDPAGLNGNIKQTFKQTIEAPTQEFSYQGTYWADGKGEGVFNVNPIVFNTNNDGWAGAEQSHVYPGATNGCELQDYSHIEADLVNGYIYEPTKQKPTSVAQFIQKIRNCADVKFVFDKDKFANYDYLAGYTTDAEGTQLWKGSVGTAVDNDQTPNNNINESDMGIYDYVQDDNLAATINNFMGATETENKKNLPWDLNETLGTGEDECKAIIRLHEKDGLNGTAAANALVGKKVPVKLVVAYNDYNVVPVQEFEVMFITPLTIDGTIGDNFVDAMVDGSFLSVAENFTFTDWNGYKVARVTPTTPASEKESYAHQLYDYYAVNEVTFLTDQTTTSLAYDAATNTYIHKDGVTDGKLPTGRSLKQMNWDESQPKSTATETSADPTHLAYFNNSGTPVNVDYEMFVDVTVKYKWGNLPKNDIKVKVSKAEGIE